jgi:hypothetical protein
MAQLNIGELFRKLCHILAYTEMYMDENTGLNMTFWRVIDVHIQGVSEGICHNSGDGSPTLNYTNITKHTVYQLYIRSWTVTDTVATEF